MPITESYSLKYNLTSSRKCRYQKCIAEGMNPLLVDSNKNSVNTVNYNKDSDEFKEASTSSKAKISNKTFAYFRTEEQIKLDFLKTYDEVYSDVLLDPRGLYLTKQIGIHPKQDFHLNQEIQIKILIKYKY